MRWRRSTWLIEASVSGEESKYGFAPEDLRAQVGELAGVGGIEIRGLMTMAPIASDPEATRPLFRRLAELARELEAVGLEGASFADLSMGMTQDYEVAVEEGATFVRIGSALVAGLEEQGH
jgi:uncharacterized pyridoxal phosphate-containing UPF0001 family protein